MVAQLEDYIASCFFGEVQRAKKGRVAFGKVTPLQDLYAKRHEIGDNIMRQFAMISSEPYLGDYGKEYYKIMKGKICVLISAKLTQ